MMHSIPDAIKGAMPKTLLSQLTYCFTSFEKVETGTILARLISMQYNGDKNIREYIMEISNLAMRSMTLKLELSDNILV